MSRPKTSLFVAGVAFAFALTLAGLTPSTASAQLGRLKKAATDAAKEKAGMKKGDASAPKEDYVITAERLDAVLAVLEPQMKSAESEAAAAAVDADYQKRKKAFETCFDNVTKGGALVMPSAEAMQRAAKVNAQIVGLNTRTQAALNNKQYKVYVASMDTMSNMSVMAAVTMGGGDVKCKPAYKPAAIIDAEARDIERQNTQTANNGAAPTGLSVAPAARAGMTFQQFGMVRERAALWALQQTNNAPVGNDKYSVFTSTEQSVLEGRGDRLKKMAPFLKGAPQHWADWGDLSNW